MFALWRWWRRMGGWRGFLADGLLAWRLFRDGRVPIFPKLIFPLYLAYFFSPINLPFEWIPFLGQVDDVGLGMLALATFLRSCPPGLVVEHATRLQQDILHNPRFGRFGRYASPSLDRWIHPR